MKKGFSLALSLLAAILLVVQPLAANYKVTTYERTLELFHQNLNAGETLQETVMALGQGSGGFGEVQQTITYDYVGRTFAGTITLSEDATISDFVYLIVPENGTLVVREGVTLTVLGAIDNYGEIENHGTIRLGSQNAPGIVQTAAASPAVWRNFGAASNAGELLIVNGTIENEGGLIENSGSVEIINEGQRLYGIINSSVFDGARTVTGVVRNAGAMTLRNEGVGIWNCNGALLQNDGTIYLHTQCSIDGAVSGTVIDVP